MKRLFGMGVVFVFLYVVFMIPTYFLPYLGSNSSLINSASLSSGFGMTPFFWLHLFSLLVLILLTWVRALVVGNVRLVIFPVLAMIFDMVPVLSLIPFIPTLFHLLAILIGVFLRPKEKLETAKTPEILVD